ncbi:TPA: IS630 transposase-related protein, partial [Neisseria meningitidis]
MAYSADLRNKALNYSGLNLNQDKATKPQTVQIVRQGEATPYWFKFNPLYYEQCKNISQTAATFNLSRNTLYLWIRLKKQTGSLKHQVTGLNAVKSDRQKPAQYVGQHQDAYLHEIAKHFDCTAATVCYALKQMGITRKK